MFTSNGDDDDDDDNGCKVDTFTTVPTDIRIKMHLSHIPMAKKVKNSNAYSCIEFIFCHFQCGLLRVVSVNVLLYCSVV